MFVYVGDRGRFTRSRKKKRKIIQRYKHVYMILHEQEKFVNKFYRQSIKFKSIKNSRVFINN